ncbi:hypothetical protein TEQG_08750 [Trichophyton equinum CBS 127.97]|uniref:Uncharacterized protein n=1 Tax=Trichophyton equinum (strain ATCC MYA-4606 / CBS 127.97) TaxID=559882 RepID=F2PZ46_TRIEC|nr:hypothetical protein TEQG_08750 [Trichophyton equinum CBS 127.97]
MLENTPRGIQILCPDSRTGSDAFDFDDCFRCDFSPSHYCIELESNESNVDLLGNWRPYQGLSSAEQADKERWTDPEGDPELYPDLFCLELRQRILFI